MQIADFIPKIFDSRMPRLTNQLTIIKLSTMSVNVKEIAFPSNLIHITMTGNSIKVSHVALLYLLFIIKSDFT